MVVIRLSRGGAKNRPFYHIVATDSRNKRDGKYLERLGYFNPTPSGSDVECDINLERTNYWLGLGAQLSNRVSKLVKTAEKNKTN
jgi:small subunit ribosomal protein S16